MQWLMGSEQGEEVRPGMMFCVIFFSRCDIGLCHFERVVGPRSTSSNAARSGGVKTVKTLDMFVRNVDSKIRKEKSIRPFVLALKLAYFVALRPMDGIVQLTPVGTNLFAQLECLAAGECALQTP